MKLETVLFLFFSKFCASKSGLRVIYGCGLYTDVYGNYSCRIRNYLFCCVNANYPGSEPGFKFWLSFFFFFPRSVTNRRLGSKAHAPNPVSTRRLPFALLSNLAEVNSRR